jgi:predicted nucleic acid-binding protein
MRTAIDTNVLSALWSKEPLASDIAKNLGNAKTEGGLVVGAPVYAELLAYPKATESFVNSFLADTGIDVDFEFQQRVCIRPSSRLTRAPLRLFVLQRDYRINAQGAACRLKRIP